MKWNPRLHLVAPCSPAEFAVRHVLESLFLLKHLPAGAAVVDVGSGGGLPIIPCLLVRDDLRATLIESSTRKAVFLHEALRSVRPPDRTQLIAARFEDIETPAADFVTCRALDRFTDPLPSDQPFDGHVLRRAKHRGDLRRRKHAMEIFLRNVIERRINDLARVGNRAIKLPGVEVALDDLGLGAAAVHDEDRGGPKDRAGRGADIGAGATRPGPHRFATARGSAAVFE